MDEVTDHFVLSTTGYLSRELIGLGDRARNFYMQGSMGHLSAVALGAAMAQPEQPLVILDGDGAVLMHLGTLASIGQFAPANVFHIVFDNGRYESTGGQPTAGADADLAEVARSVGYRNVATASNEAALPAAVRGLLASTGPGLLLVRGTISAPPKGRASETMSVDEIAARFSRELVR